MSEHETRAIRGVSGIVYDSDGRLLLAQRGREPARGLWSLPGGTVESGESDEIALIRELREETGLTVTVSGLRLTTHRQSDDGTHYYINTYECVATGGQARAGDDAAALRWVDAAGLDALEAAGQLTDGLAELLRAHGILPP